MSKLQVEWPRHGRDTLTAGDILDVIGAGYASWDLIVDQDREGFWPYATMQLANHLARTRLASWTIDDLLAVLKSDHCTEDILSAHDSDPVIGFWLVRDWLPLGPPLRKNVIATLLLAILVTLSPATRPSIGSVARAGHA